MELTYSCPRCGEEQTCRDAEFATVIDCSRCGYIGLLPPDWAQAGRVDRCPLCGVEDLYRLKDFNQKVGVLVLVGGAALAVFTRYLSLFAAAVLDLILYLTSPEVLICYSCRSRVRGHRPSDRHRRFDPRVEHRVRHSDRQDSPHELS